MCDFSENNGGYKRNFNTVKVVIQIQPAIKYFFNELHRMVITWIGNDGIFLKTYNLLWFEKKDEKVLYFRSR